MDSKGRVAVPTRYRDRLAESCGGKRVATISLMDRSLSVMDIMNKVMMTMSLGCMLKKMMVNVNHHKINCSTLVEQGCHDEY